MFKTVLCVTLVVLCALAGFMLTKKYKFRKIFMYDLYTFNERLISEVNFTRMPLSVFFTKYEYGTDFTLLLEKIKNQNFESVQVEYRYLTIKQKQITEEYFTMIGKSDWKSQSDYLKNVRAELDKEKTETYEEYKKFLSLYVKLGFLLGLVLAILLV